MTIAAGFICCDGIILSNDLQITDLYTKTTGGKSTWFSASNDVLVGITGAGYYDILAYTIETMETEIRGNTLDAVLSEIRKALMLIYKQHIRSSYASHEWGECLELLVGIVERTSDSLNYGLYSSYRTVLRKVSPCAFVGIGKILAQYIIKQKTLVNSPNAFSLREDLKHDGIGEEITESASMKQTSLIARELIAEIGENVPACGKDAKILRLPFDMADEAGYE